jgi:NitT/TauT family transport system substrate-binding protein
MSARLLFKFLGLLVAVVILAPVSLPGAEKIRFGTSFRGPHYDLPMLAAQEKGFWKQEGITVEWLSLGGGGPLHRATAAGKIDLGMDGAASALQAIGSKVPMVIVSDMDLPIEWYMWVKADGPIKQASDLKGRIVGTNRFGSSSHAFTIIFLRNLGLEKDARIVAIGGLRARIAALKTGAMHGFLDGGLGVASLKAQGEIRDVGTLKRFLPRKWSDQTVYAHRQFLQANNEQVRKAVRAILRAAAFVRDNRAWTIEKLQSFSKFSPEAAQVVYPQLSFGPSGRVNPESLKNVRKFLIDFGIVSSAKIPPVSQLYVGGLAP